MRLDRLPPGITGFYECTRERETVDPSEFKRACYSVANMLGASVDITNLSPQCRSYYLAKLKSRTDDIAVLCNRSYRYLAFAPATFDWQQFSVDFVQPVELPSAFSAVTEFSTLDADWLQSEIAADLLRELTPAEMKEVVHWGPQRIGDVIFNFWD